VLTVVACVTDSREETEKDFGVVAFVAGEDVASMTAVVFHRDAELERYAGYVALEGARGYLETVRMQEPMNL